MKSILILASHGSLAGGMKGAAEVIMGEDERVLAYNMDTYQTPQNIARAVTERIEQEPGVEVWLLCDIKGGSVANELLALCQRDGVRMLTGMNLSMVLELMVDLDDGISPERAAEVLESAKSGLCYYDAGALARLQMQETDSETF